jgi:hypothetical protein
MVSTISVIFEPPTDGSIRPSFEYLPLSHRDRNSEVTVRAAQSKCRVDYLESVDRAERVLFSIGR